MAEILVKYDTKTKMLDVTKDGKSIKDVSRVEFYNYGDTGSVTVETSNLDEEDTIYTCVKMYANDQGEDVEETSVKDNLTNNLSKLLLHR